MTKCGYNENKKSPEFPDYVLDIFFLRPWIAINFIDYYRLSIDLIDRQSIVIYKLIDNTNQFVKLV